MSRCLVKFLLQATKSWKKWQGVPKNCLWNPPFCKISFIPSAFEYFCHVAPYFHLRVCSMFATKKLYQLPDLQRQPGCIVHRARSCCHPSFPEITKVIHWLLTPNYMHTVYIPGSGFVRRNPDILTSGIPPWKINMDPQNQGLKNEVPFLWGPSHQFSRV